MDFYKVEIKKSAEKEIFSLDKKTVHRIWQKIKKLSENPRPPGVQKLTGTEKCYRIRVGGYRILYQIEEKEKKVVIYAVGHRRDIYR